MLTINKSQIIAWSGWVLLILVLLFEFKCRPNAVPSGPAFAGTSAGVKTETKIIYVHDTVVHHIPVPHLVPSETVYVELPAKVDSAFILKDYFAKRFYKDSLTDSLLSVRICDTVSQNKITSRKFDYKILRPQTIQQITNTSVFAPERFGFYLGASASFDKRIVTGCGPELLLTVPRGIAIGAGYNFLNQSFSIHGYYKFKIK